MVLSGIGELVPLLHTGQMFLNYDKRTPASDPSWIIVPCDFIRRGTKALHIIMTPKKFVSKVWRASSRSTSSAGTV